MKGNELMCSYDGAIGSILTLKFNRTPRSQNKGET